MRFKFFVNIIIINCLLSLNSTLFYQKHPDAINYNGMVVSSNEYASQIGVDILKNGGNAIDAAIAVNFALSVVFPQAGNIGGGGFMVIRTEDGLVETIDFREKAPSKSNKNMFLDDSLNVIPNLSISTGLSSGVPGTVAGMWLAHQKYGTKKWSDLIKPAIILAKNGFRLDPFNVKFLNSERYSKFLANDIESKKIFTKENSDFKINEIFVQKDLSKTLQRIAIYGAREFYEGKTASNIINTMKRTGGIISLDDLKSYQAISRKPIEFKYKDYKIYTMPPPSSGGIALAGILNQLELINLDEIPFHSANQIHLLTEIEKRVYSDRAHYLGDMDFNNIPIENLISKKYAKKRFEEIDFNKSTSSLDISRGDFNYNSVDPFNGDIDLIKKFQRRNNLIVDGIWGNESKKKWFEIQKNKESNETTHFSIVDQFGNAVSLTTTLNRRYGNGIVVDDSGFFLNNQMDDFSIKPGHPNTWGLIGNEANSIEPNKRMLSSMTPTIIENKDGDLFMVLGSPGGSTIITTIAQITTNVIDYNMSIQDAVDAQRFHHQWLPDFIDVEPYGFSKETIDKLIKLGHNLRYRASIGEANCIMIDYIDNEIETSKIIYGASDKRRDASAKGY
tara:strand:- start:1587 stop:3440 length:1854 start_codon:yes stop_codon:yes gene_type:complete